MATNRRPPSAIIVDLALTYGVLLAVTALLYLPALLTNGHAYEDPYARSFEWFRMMHLSSLALHMIAGAMTYRLASELGLRYAWVAAAIVLWHPIQVETVAYAAMQPHLVVLVCTLWASILALPLAQVMSWWRVASVLGLAYIAHEARPTGALLLPLVAVIVWSRGRDWRALVWRWRRLIMPVLLVGVALALRMALRQTVLAEFWHEDSIDRVTWAGVQMRALATHGWHFLLPLGNQWTVIHEAMARPLLPPALIGVAAVTAGVLVGSWGTRWMPWPWWIVIAMLPRLLFRETVEPLSEHHLGFVVVAWAMLIALLLEKVDDSSRS